MIAYFDRFETKSGWILKPEIKTILTTDSTIQHNTEENAYILGDERPPP